MLVVVAHPDDETFGTGSTIASAAERGVEVTVVCATRGEMGEDTSGTTHSPDELAKVREEELRTAAKMLGAADVRVLDGFADSGFAGDMPPRALAAVPIEQVVAAVEQHIVDVQPDVTIALDPFSIADHRDHKRIGDATTLAFVHRAKPGMRLYYWTLCRSVVNAWQNEMRGTGIHEGLHEIELGRPDDELTTVVDVSHLCELRWTAICEHKTQLSPYHGVSDETRRRMLMNDYFVRAIPAWDGGPQETQIF
jgi:LmbE family N-acetylglucosaminyl deacetylase